MSSTITPLADNQERFSALLDQHKGIVAKVVHTYCWHPQDREELTQDIVTQLWRSFSRYDETRSFSTWMYRVALNVAISWVRRHSLRREHMTTLGETVDQVADTQTDSTQDERMDFLRQFIEQLEPLNRALMLLYLEAHSHREIAEVLGISETNVATKISRLKQRIRQQHAKTDTEETPHGT